MVKDYPEVIQLIANFTITSLQVRIYTEVFSSIQLLNDREDWSWFSVLVLFEEGVRLVFTYKYILSGL